ncbi:hypothetical protein AALO_G00087830 [Alosa alosa]|uniref:Uncharacterized protein n=1 Tax=Alosa alosa TaxID=278164 RepID=A0AAV6GYX1_9TELE|nr:hypothetical protein AALO_G00087830 [Alosa alosa]
MSPPELPSDMQASRYVAGCGLQPQEKVRRPLRRQPDSGRKTAVLGGVNVAAPRRKIPALAVGRTEACCHGDGPGPHNPPQTSSSLLRIVERSGPPDATKMDQNSAVGFHTVACSGLDAAHICYGSIGCLTMLMEALHLTVLAAMLG